MKNKYIYLTILMFISNITHSQLTEFSTTLSPFYSKPEISGFMYFATPNNLAPGHCFQYYKTEKGDVNNDMQLINVITDSILHFTHYKYQQTYKNIPIEGTGCIEHYDQQGSLNFTNAKHAVNLNINPNPIIPQDKALEVLLAQLPDSNTYAWNDPQLETQIKIDFNNPNASYQPVVELVIAPDNYKNFNFNIDGSRFILAYKIKVVTSNPLELNVYYMDANTGNIFKVRQPQNNYDGTCGAYGYGTNNFIDTKWVGGFYYNYYLVAEDYGHNFETRKGDGDRYMLWGDMVTQHDNDDNWGNIYLTETSAHYFVQTTWDFFKQEFGRNGIDDSSMFFQVRTQWNKSNAFFVYDDNYFIPRINLGKTSANNDYAWEPSIVAHEYTHGITRLTANLEYEYESGALNESFSDIFGVVIQAKMLDNNYTDWIYGNNIPSVGPRSLINPNSLGSHISAFNSDGTPIFQVGQPDTYLGNFWCSNCPNTNQGDHGGVHDNSGVQNHWFYLLSVGGNNINDNGDAFNVTGIGMNDATIIAYLTLTTVLMNTSQYEDSRLASIQVAKEYFGECSQQFKSTSDAWYAVGLGNPNTCDPLSVNKLSDGILIYPNPTISNININLNSLELTNNIEIIDVNGRVVKTINPNTTNVDISDLNNGFYTIKMLINNNVITKKIIIQK